MCTVNDSVSVSVTSMMTMDLGSNVIACSNVPTVLTANSNIGAGRNYLHLDFGWSCYMGVKLVKLWQ